MTKRHTECVGGAIEVEIYVSYQSFTVLVRNIARDTDLQLNINGEYTHTKCSLTYMNTYRTMKANNSVIVAIHDYVYFNKYIIVDVGDSSVTTLDIGSIIYSIIVVTLIITVSKWWFSDA